MPDEEVERTGDAGEGPAGEPIRRPLSRKKKVAFSMVALLLAWMVLEVGGLLIYWVAIGKPFSWAEMQVSRRHRAEQPLGPGTAFVTVHPYVGYVYEPGQESGVTPFAGGEPVPVSSFGYIDEKDPIQTRGPDRVIVGITGGSVASFFAVNGTRQLEAELSHDPEFSGKRFVFINLALGGYKQPQQLMTLSYLLTLGAQFDLILNIDGFNEVALYELENAPYHIFPAFPRGWEDRVGVNDPHAGLARSRLLLVADRRRALALRHSRPPWRYSVLANIVWQFLDRRFQWEADEIGEQAFKSRPAKAKGPYVVTGPPHAFAGADDLYDHLAAIWAHGSELMEQLCRGQGIRYYHFLQPNQYLDGSKPMSSDERQLAIAPDHPYHRGVALGYPRLRRAGQDLRRRGIAFHDLTGIFADHRGAIYIDSCCHYNLAGYEIMARAIAGAILGDRAAGGQ